MCYNQTGRALELRPRPGNANVVAGVFTGDEVQVDLLRFTWFSGHDQNGSNEAIFAPLSGMSPRQQASSQALAAALLTERQALDTRAADVERREDNVTRLEVGKAGCRHGKSGATGDGQEWCLRVWING